MNFETLFDFEYDELEYEINNKLNEATKEEMYSLELSKDKYLRCKENEEHYVVKVREINKLPTTLVKRNGLLVLLITLVNFGVFKLADLIIPGYNPTNDTIICIALGQMLVKNTIESRKLIKDSDYKERHGFYESLDNAIKKREQAEAEFLENQKALVLKLKEIKQKLTEYKNDVNLFTDAEENILEKAMSLIDERISTQEYGLILRN